MARFAKQALSVEDSLIDAYFHLIEGTSKNLYGLEVMPGQAPVPVIGTVEATGHDGTPAILSACFGDYPSRYPLAHDAAFRDHAIARCRSLVQWAGVPPGQVKILWWCFPDMVRPEELKTIHNSLSAVADEVGCLPEVVHGGSLREKIAAVISQSRSSARVFDNGLIKSVKFLSEHSFL